MQRFVIAPIYDVSHWVPIDNFRVLDPMPWLIFTKATEDTYYLDAKYGEYAPGIRDAGIRLGSFHYMKSGDEIKQADWFSEVVLDGGLQKKELLACDMEETGISLQQIRNFLDHTQLKTGIRPLIYSSQIILESLYPYGVCPAWLKAEWLWIAEYPFNANLTNEIPTWIVPRRGSSRSCAK